MILLGKQREFFSFCPLICIRFLKRVCSKASPVWLFKTQAIRRSDPTELGYMVLYIKQPRLVLKKFLVTNVYLRVTKFGYGLLTDDTFNHGPPNLLMVDFDLGAHILILNSYSNLSIYGRMQRSFRGCFH